MDISRKNRIIDCFLPVNIHLARFPPAAWRQMPRQSLILPSPIDRIERMLEAETLQVGFTPIDANAVVVKFDVRRLDVHLGPLREACGW